MIRDKIINNNKIGPKKKGHMTPLFSVNNTNISM